MNTAQIIAKYGGADLALNRFGELTVLGRALTPEEDDEAQTLHAHEENLRAALAAYGAGRSALADKTPAPQRVTPLEWWGRKRGPWPMACLAAALRGWDPACEEQPRVSEAEYDAALAEAQARVDACRTAAQKESDSSAPRRVYVQAHSDLMHAVVAYKPQPADAARILRGVRDSEAPPEQREAQLMYEFWSRVLWPKMGTPEAQEVMDRDPGGYAVGYPMAYLAAIGLRGDDVRGKLSGR
jgi:hypothetical protein